MFKENLQNSKIMSQPIEILEIILRNEPFTFHLGGGGGGDFFNVGLLGENHHKINLIASESLLSN